MTPLYHILHLEDNPKDAELIHSLLIQNGMTCTVNQVDNKNDFLAALNQGGFDIIFSDFALPSFNGMEALQFALLKCPQIPFIHISGTIGEDAAIESLKQGATDYVLKDRLQKLIPSVNRALREAKERKERKRLEKIKDEFLTVVSHEIRTPLTIIKSAVGNMQDGILGELTDEQNRAVEIASNNISRLSKIIDNILDISRYESGKARINPELLDINVFIQKVVNDFHEVAQKKNILLGADQVDNFAPIYVDSTLLAQVMFNLLDNSLRYAKSKILIRVVILNHGQILEEIKELKENPAFRLPEKYVQISVIDDGPGIQCVKVADVFNKFLQVNRAKGGAGYQGTGLGLAICKEIVELHHGKIWVESDHDEGVRFHFIIPIYYSREHYFLQEAD